MRAVLLAVVTSSLALYRALCLSPAPRAVYSKHEGGTADWWSLSEWVAEHVSQDDLFHLYAAIDREFRSSRDSRKHEELMRASEVVVLALSDESIDRLGRLA